MSLPTSPPERRGSPIRASKPHSFKWGCLGKTLPNSDDYYPEEVVALAHKLPAERIKPDGLNCPKGRLSRACKAKRNGFIAISRLYFAEREPRMNRTNADETIRSMARLHSEHQESATFRQRAVGHITAFLGHPSVAEGLALTIACWVGANLFAASLGYRVPDPPPFQWLQDAMTLISMFMVFLILGVQKHEDAVNKHRELLTLELAVLSEQKTAKVIQLLEEFRRDSPEIHDRGDHEADKLAQPANPQSVLDAIKDTRRPACHGSRGKRSRAIGHLSCERVFEGNPELS